MKQLLTPVFVLLLFVSGCAPNAADVSGLAGGNVKALDESNPDISLIIANQAEVMKLVNTCRADVTMEISAESDTSKDSNIFIKSEMVSTIDTGNRLLSSQIVTALTLLQQRTRLSQEIIATADCVYLKDDTQVKWRAKTMDEAESENLWNEQGSQLTGAQYSSLMSPENFVYSGKAKVDGNTCYVLDQNLDPLDIIELTPDLQQYLSGVGDLPSGALEKALTEMKLTYYIDAVSFHLREVYVGTRFDYDSDGKQVSGVLKLSYRYSHFNEPVSIEVPEETG
jgi:hypothetical protein